MKKRLNLSLYLTYSILCAVVYSVPMIILLSSRMFESVWLLFLGNSLFFLCVLFTIIHINNKLYENGSLGTLVLSGVYITLGSITVIGLFTLLLYFGFDIASLHRTGDVAAIRDSPAGNSGNSKSAGLVFMLFVCGMFINLFVGAFASFVAAVTAKQKQTTARGKKAVVTDDVTNKE